MSVLTAHLDVPLHRSAPGAARRAVIAVLTGWGFCDEDWLDAAAVVVSELVTNAVRHGGPPIVLCVKCDGVSDMQIRVSDGSVDPPEVQHAERLDEGGRGMMLVDLISEHWGVDTTDDGKVVWFQLRTP